MKQMGYPKTGTKRSEYNTRGSVMQCELCGEQRRCNENDGMAACHSCQAELLPSGWSL